MTVFSGTTLECVAHLAGLECGLEQRARVAAFTHTSVHTAYEWFAGRRKLIGENLLRLRYFLELVGYDVVELSHAHSSVIEVGRLAAYDITSFEDLAVELGYAKTENVKDQLIRLLMGRTGLAPEKLVKIEELIHAYRDILEEKKRELRIRFPQIKNGNGSNAAEQVARCSPYLPSDTRTQKQEVSVSKQTLIRMAAAAIRALRPLAEMIASERFTAADREALRALVENDGVFYLKNDLSRLCSETAYKLGKS